MKINRKTIIVLVIILLIAAGGKYRRLVGDCLRRWGRVADYFICRVGGQNFINVHYSGNDLFSGGGDRFRDVAGQPRVAAESLEALRYE